jgi:hypothetical protein
MARYLLSVAALVACALSAEEALGAGPPPPTHGAISGAHVLWDTAGLVRLTSGCGVVDGKPFSTIGGAYAGPRGMNIPVYCYVVNDAANNDPNFTPTTFTVGCHFVPPMPDGHATGGLSNALFVGSVMLGPSGSMVPFYRNGDQVILTPDSAYSSDFGGITEGLEIPANFPQKISKNDVQPELWGIGLLPLSASEAIVDAVGVNIDSVDRYLCFLDPNNDAITNGNRDCQAEFAMDRTVPGLPNSLATSRVEVNVGPGAGTNLAYGVDTSILGGVNSLKVYLAWQGYIEPISHLQPR